MLFNTNKLYNFEISFKQITTNKKIVKIFNNLENFGFEVHKLSFRQIYNQEYEKSFNFERISGTTMKNIGFK